MENQTANHHYRWLIIVVFFIFVVFLAVLNIFRLRDKSVFFGGISSEVQPTPTPTPTPSVTRGALSMLIDGESRHSQSDYLILEIKADSQNINVVGYDVLLDYDSQAFELIQAKSSVVDFDIYKISLPNRLTLTGVKKTAAVASYIWSGEKIIELVFRPLKTGQFNFRILGSAGKEKTQIVDDKSKVYYPQIDEAMVEIF